MSKINSRWRICLRPLARLYSAITGFRGWLYDAKVVRSYTSKLPVISVGNVTAGGNGKTPLCLHIAEELRGRGLKPVILSRGYGGRSRGPRMVKPDDAPRLVGDEPALMSRSGSVPVYIARSRVAGVRLIERDRAGNVVILDDGFQHRALARDVDIVSVFAGSAEAIDHFLAGEILPLGRFREDRRRALHRASMVVVAERKVVTRPEALPPIDSRLLAALPQGVSVFRSHLEPTGVFWLEGGSEVPPTQVVAFAGIANPEGFFESLKALGFPVITNRAFADHYAFAVEDLREICNSNPDLPLVCTEKDAVKLSAMPVEIRRRCAVLRVRLRVAPADAFAVQIMRRIRPKVEGQGVV